MFDRQFEARVAYWLERFGSWTMTAFMVLAGAILQVCTTLYMGEYMQEHLDFSRLVQGWAEVGFRHADLLLPYFVWTLAVIVSCGPAVMVWLLCERLNRH